jgi:hypothetical protein
VNRRTLAALILTAWAGSLGWLVQRHYLQATPRDQTPRWPVPPGSAFRTVRLGDRQYGVAALAVDTASDGLRVTELLTIDLPQIRANTPRRTSLRVESMYTRGLQLRSWQSDLLSDHGRVTAVGVVSGDTLLTVINTPRDEPAETLSIPLRRPIVLPSAVPLVAASRGLPRPGSKLNIEVYDPLDHELRVEHLAVAAESVFTVTDSAEYSETLRRWRSAHSDTVRAWRIDAIEHGLPHASWVDAAGMTVREDHALGARLDRTAFEMANTNFRAHRPPLWDTSRTAPTYLLREGRSLPRQELIVLAHLAPVDPLPAVTPGLVGGWQERIGDTLRIRPRIAEDSQAEFPGPTEMLIGVDSAMIQTATRIASNERTPDKVAQALTGWVSRTITLRDGSGARSAGATLRRRDGTAEERAFLLVALARAAGLEARPVWGLALMDGQWLLRPWAEYRNPGWTPLDPAASGKAASVGRVRLATGGRPRMIDLALRVGRLRMEVLEAQP